MTIHVVHQPGLVLQEAHMPELVQLIRTDRALEGSGQIPGHIGG